MILIRYNNIGGGGNEDHYDVDYNNPNDNDLKNDSKNDDNFDDSINTTSSKPIILILHSINKKF